MYVATYMSWSSLIIYFLTYESSTFSLNFNEHRVALLHTPPPLFLSLSLSQSCETYAVPRPVREERRRFFSDSLLVKPLLPPPTSPLTSTSMAPYGISHHTAYCSFLLHNILLITAKGCFLCSFQIFLLHVLLIAAKGCFLYSFQIFPLHVLLIAAKGCFLKVNEYY